jgi:glutaconate CoA-transferase subunit B
MSATPPLSPHTPAPHWSAFSYIVINLARQIRAGEVTFSGVNSTLPMPVSYTHLRAHET